MFVKSRRLYEQFRKVLNDDNIEIATTDPLAKTSPSFEPSDSRDTRERATRKRKRRIYVLIGGNLDPITPKSSSFASIIVSILFLFLSLWETRLGGAHEEFNARFRTRINARCRKSGPPRPRVAIRFIRWHRWRTRECVSCNKGSQRQSRFATIRLHACRRELTAATARNIDSRKTRWKESFKIIKMTK